MTRQRCGKELATPTSCIHRRRCGDSNSRIRLPQELRFAMPKMYSFAKTSNNQSTPERLAALRWLCISSPTVRSL
jgi:hypothetical protein